MELKDLNTEVQVVIANTLALAILNMQKFDAKTRTDDVVEVAATVREAFKELFKD